MKCIQALVFLVLGFWISACGNTPVISIPAVYGTATFVMGPTAPLSGVVAPTFTEGDYWAISPDQARVYVPLISFRLSDGTLAISEMGACNGIYDRTLSSSSTLFQCTLLIPQGVITEVVVSTSASAWIYINGTNGIYTDQNSNTGLTGTLPSSGANAVLVTVPNTANENPYFYNQGAFLTQNFTVTSSDHPNLSVSVDLIHTVLAKVVSGALTVQTASPRPLVNTFVSFSNITSSELYSAATTADSVDIGVSSTLSETEVNYSSTTPLHVTTNSCVTSTGPNEAWNVSPLTAPVQDLQDQSLRAGGYLGLDGLNLAWALPSDYTYSTYLTYLTLGKQAVLGAASTLKCQLTATPPTPTDAQSYTSGGDTVIAAPDKSVNLSLIAH